MVRNSVKSGQEALGHVGNIANHAKKALHSARFITPKVLVKKLPTLVKQPLREAVVVTPRIFDFAEGDDEQFGRPLGRVSLLFILIEKHYSCNSQNVTNVKDTKYEPCVQNKPVSKRRDN